MHNTNIETDYSAKAAHNRIHATEWDKRGYPERAAQFRKLALDCERLAKLAKLGRVN